MQINKNLPLYLLFLFYIFSSTTVCFAQALKIKNDAKDKKIVFGNNKITVTLDYDKKANVSSLLVNGQSVIEGSEGIYTAIRTTGTTYSTLKLVSDPLVKVANNTIRISGIIYGDKSLTINETRTFTISEVNVKFDMDRTLSKAIMAEQVAVPVFMFDKMDTWEGA